jgi:hypothetical protein
MTARLPSLSERQRQTIAVVEQFARDLQTLGVEVCIGSDRLRARDQFARDQFARDQFARDLAAMLARLPQPITDCDLRAAIRQILGYDFQRHQQARTSR